MAFTYRLENDKPVFKLSIISTVFAWIILPIGLVVLFFGILLVLVPDGSPGGAMITCGAGLFLTSLFFLIRSNVKKWPRSLEFDNQRHVFQIRERDGFETDIPYGELKDFKIRPEKKNGYIVYMLKEDGSTFELYASNGKDKAEKLKNELKSRIDLEGERFGPGVQPLPDYISIKDGGGSRQLCWRNTFAGGPISLILFTAFFSILAGIGLVQEWPVFLLYGVAALYGVVLVLVIRAFIHARFFSFVIHVGMEGVSYGVSRTVQPDGSFDLKSKKSIAYKDLHKTQFNFNAQSGVQHIYLLRKDEYDQLQDMQKSEVQLGDILGIIRLVTGIFKIPMLGLPVSAGVLLERELDKAIGRFHGDTEEL